MMNALPATLPVVVVLGNVKATLQDSTTLNTLNTWTLEKVAAATTTVGDLQSASGFTIGFNLKMPDGSSKPLQYILKANPPPTPTPAGLILGSLANYISSLLASAPATAVPLIYATGLYDSNQAFDMGDGTILTLSSGVTLNFTQGGPAHTNLDSLGNVTLDVSGLLAVPDTSTQCPVSFSFPPYPPITVPVEQIGNGLQHVISVTSDGLTVHSATLNVTGLLSDGFRRHLRKHLPHKSAKPQGGFKITQTEVTTACQVISWALSASRGQFANGSQTSSNGTIDFKISVGFQLLQEG